MYLPESMLSGGGDLQCFEVARRRHLTAADASFQRRPQSNFPQVIAAHAKSGKGEYEQGGRNETTGPQNQE